MRITNTMAKLAKYTLVMLPKEIVETTKSVYRRVSFSLFVLLFVCLTSIFKLDLAIS